MICNFPSVFANEYKRIKPEKCAVEYPPRAFRAFSRPFFSPSIVSASTGVDTDTHATPWIKFTHLSGDSCKKKERKTRDATYRKRRTPARCLEQSYFVALKKTLFKSVVEKLCQRNVAWSVYLCRLSLSAPFKSFFVSSAADRWQKLSNFSFFAKTFFFISNKNKTHLHWLRVFSSIERSPEEELFARSAPLKGFYDAQSSEQSDGKPKRGRKEEKEL